MKAAIHSRYGPPEELAIQEVSEPVPQKHEVLIQIKATTVTSSDCNARNFTFVPGWLKLVMKLSVFGLRKPKHPILGLDLAGEVVSVGKAVTRFEPGDAVIGTPEPAYGTHAEYITMPEDGVLVAKPENLTWEEAATLPLAGNTALYFLRDLANLQAGQSILINGASGAIGTFAVQLAVHYFRADVTAVCSTANLDLVRSLGAQHVIDYTREDFTRRQAAYDVIFDVVNASSFKRSKKALRPGGLYLATVPTFSNLRYSLLTKLVGTRKVKCEGATPSVENLEILKNLVEEGLLRAVVGKTYPLEKIVEAYRHAEGGHKVGSIAITV